MDVRCSEPPAVSARVVRGEERSAACHTGMQFVVVHRAMRGKCARRPQLVYDLAAGRMNASRDLLPARKLLQLIKTANIRLWA